MKSMNLDWGEISRRHVLVQISCHRFTYQDENSPAHYSAARSVEEEQKQNDLLSPFITGCRVTKFCRSVSSTALAQVGAGVHGRFMLAHAGVRQFNGRTKKGCWRSLLISLDLDPKVLSK